MLLHNPFSIFKKEYWMDDMQFYDFNNTSNAQVIKNIFKDISEDHVQYLLNHSHIKKHQKGEMIIQRDNQINNKNNNKSNHKNDDDLYILLDGIIQVGYLSPSGRFHAFNYYSEKNFINLFSCLQNEVPEYDYYAFNQVRILSIPKSIFFDLIESNLALSQALMRLLALRMHHLMAELKFLHIANISQKVAKTLLSLAHQYGIQHELGTEIKLKISQHDLADLLSASRQTVNKEIQKLVMADVLNWQYENIIIKNIDDLKLKISAL